MENHTLAETTQRASFLAYRLHKLLWGDSVIHTTTLGIMFSWVLEDNTRLWDTASKQLCTDYQEYVMSKYADHPNNGGL